MSQIEITINGKTHQFKAGDDRAIKNMPWSERKQLIEILEQIKQVEYVKSQPPVQQPNMSAPIVNEPVKSESVSPVKTYDKSIKPGHGDVDSIMNRLILEEKKHQSTIPEKGVVVKWMLLTIGLFLVIAYLI